MGKKQPSIKNRKKIKSYAFSNSSKKSKRSNNYSKRAKKNFTHFYYKNGFNSKKSSKKSKFLENSSKRKKRNEEMEYITNISNNTNFTNNNYIILNSFYNNTNFHMDRPEWMSVETSNIINPQERFSKEIMDYVEFISPKDQSFSYRQSTMNILKQIIKRKKPEWKVHLFGSFKQGTSTFFSDLDFEIIIDKNSSRKKDIDELFYLMKILRKNEFSNNIKLIRARVPILKATCTTTGINVDISVNRHNGYQAADLIRNILSKHKILRPIIIILKILLRINELNEAHTGGMSSFLLFHLVYFFFIKNKKNEINVSWETKNGKNIDKINKKIKSDDNNKVFVEESNESDDEESSNSNNGIKITKAHSFTDDGYNSNEEDSNVIQNGPSTDSDFDQNSESNENTLIMNRIKLPYTSNSSEDFKNNNFEENCEDDEDEEDTIVKNYDLGEYEDMDIGIFLLDFLHFYGFDFNYNECGLKVTEDENCEIFFKAERFDMDCSDTISAESIQESGVDVGKSCFKYDSIKRIFMNAYNTIKAELNNNGKSIFQALNFPTV